MPVYNDDQLKAIYAGNQNLLVSAAAGSGKTTVMIRKIVEELLSTEKSIDRYLVITFTRDAADHMRRKLEEELIRAAAEETGVRASRANRALHGIDGASISTIHTFCLRTIREHFDMADVSPEVRPIDEDQPDQLFAQAYVDAVEQVMQPGEEVAAGKKQAVRTLFRALRQDEVQEAVQTLYHLLMGIPDPFEQLEKMLREPWNAWAEEVRLAVRLDLTEKEELAAQLRTFLDDPLLPGECVPVLEADLAVLEDFRPEEATAESLAEMKERFGGLKVLRCPPESKALYEKVRKTRLRLRGSRNLFDAAAGDLRSLEDGEQRAYHDVIAQELLGLQFLLERTAENYLQAKKELGVVDFADMEQMTCRLLKDEEIRTELLDRYTDIYVDETQDISAIQDALIQSFRAEGHSVFMVGDIKQSIYRFRHAEPDLFDRKRQSFSDAEEAESRRIFFRDNYRSCRAVIDCVNAVFERCMDREITELDYEPQDRLRANRDGEFGPVEVRLLDGNVPAASGQADGSSAAEADEQQSGNEKEEILPEDMLEAQCREAAEIIGRLTREGYRYSDIAILLRSAKNAAPKLVDCFRRLHIPAYYDGPRSFYGLPEISFFLDLLTVIQNERSDVELYGALKNLPFSFTDEELADVRLEKRDGAFWEAFRFCANRNEKLIDTRCAAVREKLHIWRKKANASTVSDLIWQLMRETGFYASRGAYQDGALRQANLDALYQKALDLENRGIVRLPDFLSEIRRIQISDQKSTDAPSGLGEGDDLVRIMTMHSSKGLEFPAVILMNLHQNLRRKPRTTVMRAELGGRRPLGVYLPMIDRTKHIRRDTFGRRAFEARAVRNMIAEDTRLLYVAMTRAENRLFLLGTVQEKDWDQWSSQSKKARLWHTRSMLDMVMPAVLACAKRPATGETVCAGDWLLSVSMPRPIEESEEKSSEHFEETLRTVLSNPPDFRPEDLWTREEPDPAPLKTSVSTLVHGRQDRLPEEEETVEIKRMPETVFSSFRLSDVPSRPAFLEEEGSSGAEIGTLTHRFLRLTDLTVLRGEADPERRLREQLDRMVENMVFLPEEAGKIRIRQVAAFLRTPLGIRLTEAEGVRREWPFTIRMDPEKPTMLQGMIDAAFKEPDGWVLLDYKTDRDTEQERFVARHERQMNWYRVAVERVTGEPVKEMWLVALREARADRVRRMELQEIR